MTKSNFALLLILTLSLVSCKKEPIPYIEIPVKDPVPIESISDLARMNQVLGWKIFNEEQRQKPNKNVLLSPFSIQTALTMAMNGAKGNTLSEIQALMGCDDCSLSDLNPLYADLTTLLTEQSGQAKLTVANRFFYDQNRVNVKTPFLDVLSLHYNSGAENVDFNIEQDALAKINGWVKTNTNGKIEKILDRITNLDVAFLINALHFKSDWASGFSPNLTYSNSFKNADGSVEQVDFVNADRNFSFATNDQFNLVDLPFKDSIFSVSLIQASANNTDANWHSNIQPDVWKNMYSGMQYNRAMVFFPKLKMAYDNNLIESLKNLGVQTPFDDSSADFTLLGTASKNIFINQIKHKAILEMDEKGAEGAAVTSIGFGINSVPPTFWFNHPFVLVLRHIPSNTMIFTGFVADAKE